MPNLSPDSKALIREAMKTEGWRLWKAAVQDYANVLRREATEKEVALEERLWNSAFAKGLESAVDTADIITKK